MNNNIRLHKTPNVSCIGRTKIMIKILRLGLAKFSPKKRRGEGARRVMVCNVMSTTEGTSFASFMGCNVQSRRDEALFSYLMGGNVQRSREKWVICESSRKLGGCKEMRSENGSF